MQVYFYQILQINEIKLILVESINVISYSHGPFSSFGSSIYPCYSFIDLAFR